MYHEKIVINKEGDKVCIRVNFWLDHIKPCYRIDLSVCKKGKRKFIFIKFDDYAYRSMSMPERRAFELTEYKKLITEDQINEAKMELWQLLKPINL